MNWIKDKAFRSLEHEVMLQNAKMETLELQIARLKSEIQSVRSKLWRSRDSESYEETKEEDGYAEIVKAFGGEVPFELRQKYNKEKG